MFWLAANGGLLGAAYLLGSLPPGYLAGRLLKGIDIRDHGSGSTGATNVLRTVGKIPALVVLLVDVLKGSGAIVLVRWLYTLPAFTNLAPMATNFDLWLSWVTVLAGLAVLLGHSKSIWLGFRGGKSAATSLGVLVALNASVGLGTLGIFGLVLGVSRIVSLGSITAAIGASVLMLVMQQPLPYVLLSLTGGLYVVWLHRANLQRLWTGVEPRIGEKLPEASQSQESAMPPG